MNLQVVNAPKKHPFEPAFVSALNKTSFGIFKLFCTNNPWIWIYRLSVHQKRNLVWIYRLQENKILKNLTLNLQISSPPKNLSLIVLLLWWFNSNLWDKTKTTGKNTNPMTFEGICIPSNICLTSWGAIPQMLKGHP